MINLIPCAIGFKVTLAVNNKYIGVIYPEEHIGQVFEPGHHHAWTAKLLAAISQQLAQLNKEEKQ